MKVYTFDDPELGQLRYVDGKRYLDCLAAYSAVNQGHNHPRIVAALIDGEIRRLAAIAAPAPIIRSGGARAGMGCIRPDVRHGSQP